MIRTPATHKQARPGPRGLSQCHTWLLSPLPRASSLSRGQNWLSFDSLKRPQVASLGKLRLGGAQDESPTRFRPHPS